MLMRLHEAVTFPPLRGVFICISRGYDADMQVLFPTSVTKFLRSSLA